MVRKFTKSKAIFPTDDAIRKVIYMCVAEISKKWTSRFETGDWRTLSLRFILRTDLWHNCIRGFGSTLEHPRFTRFGDIRRKGKTAAFLLPLSAVLSHSLRRSLLSVEKIFKLIMHLCSTTKIVINFVSEN
jgi:hypothetical protein